MSVWRRRRRNKLAALEAGDGERDGNAGYIGMWMRFDEVSVWDIGSP